MSKDEVKSLNDLAMAGGGQLTINPHTGLPEAGFLSSILPMIAGFALGPAGFGLTQMQAGIVSGGLGMLLNPKGGIMGGLMAGMGAYGGAGLGESLAKTGMEEATKAEIAKNTALTQPGGQAVFTPQALAAADPAQYGNLADVATKGLPAGMTPDAYANTIREAYAPATQMTQATMDRVAQGAGFGDQSLNLTTQTAGNRLSTAGQGFNALGTEAGRSSFMDNIGGGMGLAKTGLMAAAPLLADMNKKEPPAQTEDKDMGQRYTYNPNKVEGPYTADPSGRERRYFNPSYTPISADKAKSIYGFADGGIATATPMPGDKPSYQYDPAKQLYAKIESMPSNNQKKQEDEFKTQAAGNRPQENPAFDAMMATPEGRAAHEAQMANINSALTALATMAIPGMGLAKFMQSNAPSSATASSSGTGQGATTSAGNVGTGNGSTASGVGTGIGASVGNAGGGLKAGGLSDAQYNLGGYSDGGRLLRGPGDGVSDSIPAVIGKKQPARLADGEFVVPARIVSELGNGSTEAGARKLYAMMDRIQKARGSTVGKGRVAKNSKAEKYLPA
jgi:hypothetical protein